MAKKKGIINNEDKIAANANAESTLSQMKKLENQKIKKLERINIPNGYVLTTDTEKWNSKII